MDVTVLDVTDVARFDVWCAVVNAASLRSWPGEPGWQPAELRASIDGVDGGDRTVPLALDDDDGRLVGAAWVELPTHDNTDLGMVQPYVLPEHRRRGHGSALLAAAERLVVGEGRHLVGCWQDERTAEQGRSPGRRFAEARGFTMVQRQVRRDLWLPVDPARLADLEAACRPFAEGYRILTFADRWPAEWVADRVEFGVRMSTDAPRGESAREDEVWDERRLRAREALLAGSNRTLLCAVAQHEATGRLAAFTEIAIPRGAPEKVYQHDTLVLAEHRGRRLGTLIKLANLRVLAEESPATRVVVTHNADDNGPMIAVNEALGCVVAADALTWEKKIA